MVVGGVEKELNIHLDHDTPIQAVEEVAIQMIAYCSKVKEQQAAQAAAVATAAEPDIAPAPEAKAAE